MKGPKVTQIRMLQAAQVGPDMFTTVHADKDKAQMSLCPAGVYVIRAGVFLLIPYGNVASVVLAGPLE